MRLRRTGQVPAPQGWPGADRLLLFIFTNCRGEVNEYFGMPGAKITETYSARPTFIRRGGTWEMSLGSKGRVPTFPLLMQADTMPDTETLHDVIAKLTEPGSGTNKRDAD